MDQAKEWTHHRPGALRSWGQALLSVLYPPRCVACHGVSEYAPGDDVDALMREGFCSSCRDQVYPAETAPGMCCSVCGHPTGTERHRLDQSQGTCESCREQRPAYRQARATYDHLGSLTHAVYRFKYGGRLEVGRILCGLFAGLAPKLPMAWSEYRCAVPVPLHPKRLRQRGFQQAWMLLHRLPLPPHMEKRPALLQRTRHTDVQAGLPRQARFANLDDAFAVSPGERDAIKDASILLIDDVLTTGATADACARALLDAGAHAVDVITLCRAIS